jgi:hypothetical protein
MQEVVALAVLVGHLLETVVELEAKVALIQVAILEAEAAQVDTQELVAQAHHLAQTAAMALVAAVAVVHLLLAVLGLDY